MNATYRVERGSKNYQLLVCDDNNACIQDMEICAGDCFHVQVQKNGYTTEKYFGLRSIGCFEGVEPYTRLTEVPPQYMEELAARIYELLFMKSGDEQHAVKLWIDEELYQQIVQELHTLQETERRLIDSGELNFPEICVEELAENI